jgi:hypothetical protein
MNKAWFVNPVRHFFLKEGRIRRALIGATILPEREIFCILSPNTTLQMKICRFPFIYKLYKFIIIFKLQMVVL